MAVTTKKTFPATTNATTTVFSPVSIQLNNQDDLDVYVTLSGGTRVLQLRQSTGSTAQSSHPQVNNTDGLYFPAVSAGTNLINYTLSSDNNTITFNSALPSGAVVFCERRTRDASGTYTTFASGSTIRATDLNNSSTESNFTAQDARNKALDLEGSIFGGIQPSINGVAQPFVNSSKIIDGSIATADIADSAVTAAKLANSTIITTKLANGVVTTDKIAADAVTNAKIADDSIDSEHYVDGSIDTAHIGNSQVTTAKIADGNVTTAKLAADAVTGAKIADDSIDSEHYVDGSIDTAHIGNLQVTTAKIADDAITTAKIADNAITRATLADDAVGTQEIDNNAITAPKINAAAVENGKIAPGAVTTDKIATNAVTTDKIADSELSTLAGMQSTTASNLASSTALTATTAELNQLDGITLETSVTTNSNTRIPTSKAVNDLVLSVTNALGGFVAIANETSFPTANPDPSNNAGTVVSISQLASGLAVNSSGVATITNGAGTGNTVTITGFPSSLHSQTLPASSGLQVQTTSTLHTYTFHKQLASAADIQAISATVNSFSNRYRVSASAPTSSLDGGDLWYDTTNSKLMVYSSQNSAWEESSAIGNFFISTISSSSATGGGSATANGTAYRFTISDAPVSAQQLIVSVDGVIQKPNAGSSQPSEGFVLVGNDIIFGSAPANGASMFVTVIGATVGIGTPSNNTVTTAILQNGSVTTAKIVDANVTTAKITDANVTTAKIADSAVTTAKIAANAVTSAKLANNSVGTSALATGAVTTSTLANDAVTSAKIVDGTIVNADINASAAINVSKLSGVLPLTGGTMTGNLAITREQPIIAFNDSTDNPDYYIGNIDGSFLVRDTTNNTTRLTVNTDGHVDVTGNLDVGAGLDVTGNITVSGTVDGVDIAALNTTVGNITTDVVSDTSPQLGGELDTNFQNIHFNDSSEARFGSAANGDMAILHDGTDSIIDNQTGNLFLRSGSTHLQSLTGEDKIVAEADGKVELYYDNSKKVSTESYGVSLHGLSSSTAGNILYYNTSTGQVTYQSPPTGGIPASGGTFTGDINVGGGAGALNVNGGSDIRFTNGTWTGDATKIQYHNSSLYIQGGSSNSHAIIFRDNGGTDRWFIDGSGHFTPSQNNQYNIGSTTNRVANVYVNDFHMSNEGHSNDVDGTWGDWTIQEGESDLFLKNNRSGKKYKFNLTEVS